MPASRARSAGWLACLLLAVACFRPRLPPQSFYCHPSDVPACPDGQDCVDGPMGPRCQYPGTQPEERDGGGSDDFGVAPDEGSPPADDLAMSQPHDLAMPSPDLLSCVAPGGDCYYHNNKKCCSGYCTYASNTCK